VVDNLSREKRSKVMSSIRGKDTRPELAIRKLLWKKGIRYRKHDRTVYGTPDISNKSRKVAVFIDGCFWHGCNRCYKEPTTNVEFWRNKINRNKERRRKVKWRLKNLGWNVIELWEHQIVKNPATAAEKIIYSKKSC